MKLPADAVMIVSVHTADGSPMPVAAARYPLGKFPVTVVLDDSNSMIESRKLSNLESVITSYSIHYTKLYDLRISYVGNFIPGLPRWHLFA